ncbi:putative zinc-binding oxidoreductase [Diaporthe ampelina]|uniref:Putative zinc-binding oxidoreductase n=1 Tax=Diaporthe ampelina TaxID=1214573 RepID=A0A0G2HG77_9PEZI|nr:putative zinc-binding oxidoreductase [Diaporthe ampelina]
MKVVNYAAWIPSHGAELEVADAPFPTDLADDEVIIKNKAVAVNPVDWKIQSAPEPIFNIKYPNILGSDVAGEVVGAGASVKHLKKGDRVIGHALGLSSGSPAHGGFQLYPKLKAVTVARIPEAIPFEQAVVLPLSVSTAAAGLYLKDTLGLQLPTAPGSGSSSSERGGPEEEEKKKKKKETLLLWGGSSSVGSSVVQLAVASGYDVVATASPANYDYVKSLGASLVLDYHNPDVVAILAGLLQASGARLAGAYDAIGSDTTVRASAAVVGALGGGRVASVGAAPADAGGDKVAVVRIGAANLVAREPEVVKATWGEYVPAALEAGSLVPRPRELVVGRGLYFVQNGLDTNKAGVSAAKVVITL